MEEKRDRSIVDIDEDWSWSQKLMANILNASGVIAWVAVTIILLYFFGQNDELVGLRNAYMNLSVPASAYGILSLVAGLAGISWLFPQFNPREAADPMVKSARLLFWGLVALSLAIIIASVA